MLREWPRLRGWLEDDAEAHRRHAHLAAAARDWDAGGREPAELYRGARLAARVDRHDADLNALERTFLAAANEHADRELTRERRANRRLRTTVAAVAVLLVAAVGAGAVALSQRSDARQPPSSPTPSGSARRR